jgi:hypothetical protein
MNLVTKIPLLFALLAPAAYADLVTNGGFEQPGTLAANPGYQYFPNNSTLSGWLSISDGVGEESYLMNKNRSNGTYLPRVYDGAYAFGLNTGNSIQTQVSLVQGTTYDLSFVGRANVVGASPLSYSIDGNNLSVPTAVSFSSVSFQFTASSTNPNAILNFTNASPNGGNRLWSIDNVSIVAAPEPEE